MKVTVSDPNVTRVVVIPNGPAGPEFAQAWGAFYDLDDQTNPIPDAVNLVEFKSGGLGDGVTIVGDTAFEVALDGVYNFQFSIVAEKPGGGTSHVDVWALVDGQAVDASNTRATLAGNGAYVVLAWNLYLALTAGQQIELAWSSPLTDVHFPAYVNLTNPVRPDVPSTIGTVMRIAELPPN